MAVSPPVPHGDSESDEESTQSESLVTESLVAIWDDKRDQQLTAVFEILDEAKRGFVTPEMLAVRPWRMKLPDDGSDRVYLPEFLAHWRDSKLAGLPTPDFDKVMDQMTMAAMNQINTQAPSSPKVTHAGAHPGRRPGTKRQGGGSRYTGTRSFAAV